MKKETRIKVTAIAVGFTLATFVGTVVLAANEHPAQWIIACTCILGMLISTFFGVTIED